jgi:hypothetical protein
MNLEQLLALLRERVNRVTSVEDVTALMAPYASDSAWIYLGGSGARGQIFQLPEQLRAYFQFDGHDRLVGYAAYQSAEPWTPAAMALPANVSLILADGLQQ